MQVLVNDVVHGAVLASAALVNPVNGTLLPYQPSNDSNVMATIVTGPCPKILGYTGTDLCAVWLLAAPTLDDSEGPISVQLNASVCS